MQKTYLNCIWILPPEWHGLNIYSALLTKVYWSVAIDIVRACVTATSPTTFKPDVTRKSNIQVRFGSKAMGSFDELSCHHSLSSTDPLLDELICYLPTRFSHTFEYIVCEDSDDDPYYSDSSISAFYSDDSTSFS